MMYRHGSERKNKEDINKWGDMERNSRKTSGWNTLDGSSKISL